MSVDRMDLSRGFMPTSLQTGNLDLYLVRTAIVRALSREMGRFRGGLLDVGCGRMPYRELVLAQSRVETYVGLDVEQGRGQRPGFTADVTWDGIKMPFADGCFQTVMATEVLEHCPEPSQTLTEIGRVLAPDGLFFFTVPFLWNLHEVPHDEYRYTPFALERHLRDAGFANIDIKATGGWHASLAQMLGLWVRRAPMGKRKRRYLSYLLKPVIAYLARKDTPPTVFTGGTMITGLYGTARKPGEPG